MGRFFPPTEGLREGKKSCRTTCNMVLKQSSSKFMDDIKKLLNFISKEHGVNIPLTPKVPASILNPNQLEKDRDDFSGSTGSVDSYYSCDSSLPSKKDKQVFFNILKHLLEDRSILQEGHEEERWCDKNTLKLKYMGRECQALILDEEGNELWERIMETKCIYLNWRGDEVEPLSLENLQIVQNELQFLGIQNRKICRCFSLARTQLMEEPDLVLKNTKLKIICGEVILTFGRGNNIATVLYDDNENIPKYNMKMAHWYTNLYRILHFFPAWLVTIFKTPFSLLSLFESVKKWFCKHQSLCSEYKQS